MTSVDLTPAAHDLARLGTSRRLDRSATRDGFLTVAAIDHPAGFFPAPGGNAARPAAVVAAKLEIIEGLAGHASALLLDPTSSIGQAIATGALPGDVGLISNIELLRETPEGLDRTTRLQPDWTPERIARLGADGVKFVFFHREEAEREAAEQRAIVSDLAARCRAVDMPLIIEPLWYRLNGDDTDEPAGSAARTDAILRSAVTFAALGADVLKLQFPGVVATAAARADAAAAARALDGAITVPWVLLSEGVGFDDFAVQVELAARAGASGFMAGRAVWGDVTRAVDPPARRAALIDAARRLDVLTASVRAHGRPWRERAPLHEVQASLPADWHRRYGATGRG